MKRNVETNSLQLLISKADLCVSCGMCLPHCPTYQIAQSESESPRGRLSLISALLKSEIRQDDVLLKHLDHCLLCRSCESCCPANVPFADIVDGVWEHIDRKGSSKRWLKKIILKTVPRKKLLNFISSILYFSGLIKLVKYLPFSRNSRYGRALQFFSAFKPLNKRKDFYPANNKSQHAVALFTGCVHEFVDAQSVTNAIQVLNYLGVNVYIPDQQCCGAMHLHNGDAGRAKALSDMNSAIFQELNIEAVVSLASACTVTLIESEKKADRSLINYIDIIDYLENLLLSVDVEFRSVNKNMLLHFPCTQKNVLKNTRITESLLNRIPGLVINKMPGEIKCCGAAGTYFIDQPEWSDKLKENAGRVLNEIECDVLVTSNVGCSMQFKSILKDIGCKKVLHPIDIIAQSLKLD
ncbi:MAG: (Fe-S)-binding protein [Gammaproteobacteria bacterium]|nr:(Fe-S)-binding protein [Gammaproteobacteria bacterium]